MVRRDLSSLPPEDSGALPDFLVKRVIQRTLRLSGPELAWGLYWTHVWWRQKRNMPFLSPEEVGLLSPNGETPLPPKEQLPQDEMVKD